MEGDHRSGTESAEVVFGFLLAAFCSYFYLSGRLPPLFLTDAVFFAAGGVLTLGEAKLLARIIEFLAVILLVVGLASLSFGVHL